MNRQADESDNQLRVSADCKATVKIGEFSRGGTCRVKVAALDHDYTPDATLVPIGMLVLSEAVLVLVLEFLRRLALDGPAILHVADLPSRNNNLMPV